MTIAYVDQKNELQKLQNVSAFEVEGNYLCVNYFGDSRNYMLPFTSIYGALDSDEIKQQLSNK